MAATDVSGPLTLMKLMEEFYSISPLFFNTLLGAGKQLAVPHLWYIPWQELTRRLAL